MSDDDISADQPDDSPTKDAIEAAADGGAVESKMARSRFWGVVPTEWELVDGSEVYDVNPSYTPEDEEVTYIEMDAVDTELPFPKYTKKRKAADYSGKLFREGDTLFARITPCTENGKTAFVDEMETDVGIGSTEYAVLSPDRERIHPLYLYYVTKSHPVRNYAISRMRGSTGRQRVPFDVFRRELDISLPPLAEQREAASVFYNLDMAIQNIRESRAKLKRLKKGVANDLFTTGIGDNETEKIRLGPVPTEIPSGWELRTIEEIYTSQHIGTNERGDDTNGENIWLIKMGNLNFGTWDLSEVEEIGRDEELMQEYALEKGDLLFNTRNTPELVGKTAVWDSDKPAIFDNNLMRIQFGEQIASSRYINYFLSSKIGRRQLRSRVQGTTSVAAIYWNSLQEVEIPVPPIDVQREIIEKLESVDKSRQQMAEEIQQYKRLKKGLMQNLLTGSVRTTDTSIEPLKQVAKHD
jgi:type I restriction enzyme S subunit